MKSVISLATTVFLLVATACHKQKLLPASRPHLVIIGVDVSKSIQTYERLTPEELSRFCHQLAEFGAKVVVYAAPIGNTNAKPFLKCEIKPVQRVNNKAPLSEQVKQKKKEDMDIEENQSSIEQFIQDYTEYVYEREPEMNSDVGGFFNKVELKLGEPQYADFQKTVFLNSDALHDNNGKKDLEPFERNRFDDVIFYASGLKNKALFQNLNVFFFESPRAVTENYLFTIKSN